MKKEELLDILRNYKNERANYYGIMTIGIFGSTARGEACEESDVDIVTYKDNMNLFLKKRIDEEAVYA